MTNNDIRIYLKTRIRTCNEAWKFYFSKAYMRIDNIGGDIIVDADSKSILLPTTPTLYFTSIEELKNLLDNIDKYSSHNSYSDSCEYLDLFYPFEPNDIWRMAITKSERKRAILNKVYDRLELYLSDLVEYYRKAIPSLPFDKWYFERRRHPQKSSRSIAYYDSSDASIHFSLSAFMYGELRLRNTILHEMCHVKYLDHKPHFWKLLFDIANRVGLDYTLYYKYINNNTGKNQIIHLPIQVNYTKKRTITKGKISTKKKTSSFPDIARHRYNASHEAESINGEATKIVNDINHGDYLTEKFDKAVSTLWEYTTNGSLRAAILLSNMLEYAMKYHNIDKSHLFYLTQEKMLNLGYHRIHESLLDNFYFGENFEHQYGLDKLDRLISNGSGLALINKADMIISQGGDLTEAIDLYQQAALKGYSVGWRILYCIFSFIEDKEKADSALQHFSESAPIDKTNWRWIETLVDIRPYTPPHRSLSILSKNPQSANLALKNIYHCPDIN